jgi:hypothetical protein
VAMAGGVVLQLLMDWALRSMPLDAIAEQEITLLPSAPMTLTTVVLGFFSVMVAKELRRRHRKWPYLASTLLLTLLIMARIYLGLDWLSGALVGFILGLSWTAIVGMAYRARALRPFSGAMASAIFYGTLALTFSWQVGVHLEKDVDAVRIPIAERAMAGERWWQDEWATLSKNRSEGTATPVRAFNLQVALTLSAAAESLEAAGWAPVEEADWQWVLRSLNPNADEASLPIVGRNFLGQSERLVMSLPEEIPGEQWVLRLWDSGVRLDDAATPVYLGQLTLERVGTRLWLFSHWRPSAPSPAELWAFGEEFEDLEARPATPGLLLIRPRR